MHLDTTGNPTATIEVNADITDRKQAEQALADSERQYRLLFTANPIPMFLFDEESLMFLDVNDSAVNHYGWSRNEFLAMSILDIRPPEDRERALGIIRKNRPARETLIGEICHLRKDGALMIMVVTTISIVYNGNRARLCSMEDITERKKAEKILEKQKRRFELLAHTASNLLQSTEPERLVESLCIEVLTHIDCQLFFNFLLDDKSQKLHLNAFKGISADEARKIEWLDLGDSVCGCVARLGRRIIAEHIPTTPDVRTDLVKTFGVKAYCCHPLMSEGGRIIGTLSFGARTRETFSEEDVSLMKAVTDQVAIAMERVQRAQELRESEARLKILNENLEGLVVQRTRQVRDLAKALTLTEQKQRQYLSTILHEDLQQTLFAAKTRFSLLKTSFEDGTKEELREDVTELEKLITKTLDTAKNLAIEFNPPVLKSEGLDAALKWMADNVQKRYGLRIDVSISEGFSDIREEERLLIVNLTKELLTNIVKHAKTPLASLSVGRDAHHILITVEDNGVGFDFERERKIARTKDHMGLFSIEERLNLFGGTLQVSSSPGAGAKILMTLPFDPA
jgi:PAS domain S-box-containing protein